MLGRCGPVRHRIFILSSSLIGRYISEMPCWLLRSVREFSQVIRPCSLNEMTTSLAGLHVPHELIPLFFRSYAFKRGKFYPSILSENGHPDDIFSRIKFSSLALSIRRLNEPNGGLNIGLYSKMMPFLGTSRLRYELLQAFLKPLS